MQEKNELSCNKHALLDLPAVQSPLNSLLRDAAKGLGQQMVWWGYDVRHSNGNFLVISGLSRERSPGLTGTSCYRSAWEGGWIELHGAVASWCSPDDRPGVIYVRDRARLELWRGAVPPIPGREFGTHGSSGERWEAALPLLRWIADYESRVLSQLGSGWRDGCWRAIRRLQRGKPWLPPAAALAWWRQAADSAVPSRAVTTSFV